MINIFNKMHQKKKIEQENRIKQLNELQKECESTNKFLHPLKFNQLNKEIKHLQIEIQNNVDYEKNTKKSLGLISSFIVLFIILGIYKVMTPTNRNDGNKESTPSYTKEDNNPQKTLVKEPTQTEKTEESSNPESKNTPISIITITPDNIFEEMNIEYDIAYIHMSGTTMKVCTLVDFDKQMATQMYIHYKRHSSEIQKRTEIHQKK